MINIIKNLINILFYCVFAIMILYGVIGAYHISQNFGSGILDLIIPTLLLIISGIFGIIGIYKDTRTSHGQQRIQE